MAKVPPPEHTRFKKGQSGNKSGRPRGLLTRAEVQDLVSKCYRMTRDQLKEIIESPKSSLIEIHVASIMAQGTKKGDLNSFDGLLNRTVGKVKDELEVSTPKPFIITKSDGTQVICGAEIEKEEND